ncbi:MAG: hypothetical protein AAFW95_16145, partial [Cyanobacteria bacterium J06638_6]
MTSLLPPTHTGLEPLQQAFDQYLGANPPHPGLTTIECSERMGRLLLLGQHTAPEIDDPKDVLKELETAFRHVVPMAGLPEADWAMAQSISVRIYLKLKAVAQPYAMHTFTWQPEDAARVLFAQELGAATPLGERVQPDSNGFDADAEPGSEDVLAPGSEPPSAETS